VQDIPAPTGVLPHAFAMHVSLVHSLLSSQSVGERHATHAGVAPDVSQSGAPTLQPESTLSPPASLMHGTHIGPIGAPSHTPPVHVAPGERDVCMHMPMLQASTVHAFASSQSPLPVHPTHIGIGPDVSQIGAPDMQPLSSIVPDSSSMHVTQDGAGCPSHTPPVHVIPAANGVFEHEPAAHESVVHGLPSSQCAISVQSTQTGVPESSHKGVPESQPVSVVVPVSSSMHSTHAGVVGAPSQTPPVHVVPGGSGSCEQRSKRHASTVHSLVSSHSETSRHGCARAAEEWRTNVSTANVARRSDFFMAWPPSGRRREREREPTSRQP
jgi:hypothetical protein